MAAQILLQNRWTCAKQTEPNMKETHFSWQSTTSLEHRRMKRHNIAGNIKKQRITVVMLTRIVSSQDQRHRWSTPDPAGHIRMPGLGSPLPRHEPELPAYLNKSKHWWTNNHWSKPKIVWIVAKKHQKSQENFVMPRAVNNPKVS